MLIELLVSVAVVVLLGGMILMEWMAAPAPEYSKPAGWRVIAERPEVLLAGCIILCLAVLWLALLIR